MTGVKAVWEEFVGSLPLIRVPVQPREVDLDGVSGYDSVLTNHGVSREGRWA